jgi:RNA ligase
MRQLFHPGDLAHALTEKLVRVQEHPTDDLRIFNYTETAVYSGTWTNITRQCRGLIFDGAGNVIARPWPKFFNYGQTEAGDLDLDAPAEVTDKMDGSLGILYPTGGGYGIATRGSFTSDQALHATGRLQDYLRQGFAPLYGWTYLFEIVYPKNRIVLDYGTRDELVFLGAVHILTGRTEGPLWKNTVGDWPGPRAETFPARTLREALAMEPRPNAEGLVVRYIDTGHMVKIKQAEYIRLHALATQTSTITVWESLVAGTDLVTERDAVPDEFLAWVDAKTVILSGIVGSTAYGLDRPGSDVDRAAVFVAPTVDVAGLSWGPKAESVVTTGPDVTMHEIGKFCRLALRCNPSVLELLHLPEYETSTVEGIALAVVRRGAFLSTRAVRAAYGGYADGQAKYIGADPAKNAKRARHLLRLLRQGRELLATGALTVRIPAHELPDYWAFDDATEDSMRDVYRRERAALDATRSVLPERPDAEGISRFVSHVRRAHIGDEAIREAPRRVIRLIETPGGTPTEC